MKSSFDNNKALEWEWTKSLEHAYSRARPCIMRLVMEIVKLKEENKKLKAEEEVTNALSMGGQ